MKTILVLSDLSTGAEHAAEIALTIAKKTYSNVLLYSAFYVPTPVPEEMLVNPNFDDYSLFKEVNLTGLQRLAQKLSEKSQNQGTFCPEISCMNEPGSVGNNIKSIMTANTDIWLTVIGDKSKKNSVLSDFVFGSDTYEIINHTTTPLLLIPESSVLEEIATIAFATELHLSDVVPLNHLVEFAGYFHSQIIVAHVSAARVSSGVEQSNFEVFQQLRKRVLYEDVTFEDIKGDGVIPSLAKFSDDAGVDVLAMAKRRHPFYERIFHRSATKEMVNYQHIPLLILPSEEQKP